MTAARPAGRRWLLVAAAVVALGLGVLVWAMTRKAPARDKPVPTATPDPFVSPTPTPTAPPTPTPTPMATGDAGAAAVASADGGAGGDDPTLPSPSSPELGGAVGKDAQSRARAAILEGAKHCLEEAQKTQPDLGGMLTLTYTLVIEADRSLVTTPVIAEGDVPSPTLRECITRAAAAVRTPIDPATDKPGKRQRVRLPLALPAKITPQP
ncbi:MAG: hypothetical protein IT370_25540 [Deltaproteobacteria bacterium]|nr:hypothetical protein [Deltaproteobacteria bacterium]